MKLKSCILLHWAISIFHLWEPLVVFWKTMVRKQYQNLKRFTHRSTLGWGGYWEWEWEKDLLCFHKTAVPKPLFLWPIQVSNASNGLTGFTTLHILLKCTNTWESNRAYLFVNMLHVHLILHFCLIFSAAGQKNMDSTGQQFHSHCMHIRNKYLYRIICPSMLTRAIWYNNRVVLISTAQDFPRCDSLIQVSRTGITQSLPMYLFTS